jgi:uncharacterized protein YdeI (YjbR/CyaY-like superfamily)
MEELSNGRKPNVKITMSRHHSGEARQERVESYVWMPSEPTATGIFPLSMCFLV